MRLRYVTLLPLSRSIAVAAFASGVLWAGSFWNDVAPGDWTPEQVDRILSDSPWAKPAQVDFTGSRSSPNSGRGGGFPGAGRGGGYPGGAGRSRFPFPGTDGGWGGPSRYADSAFDADVTVRWESALPVRQALARSRHETDPRNEAARYYVVALTSLPLPAARMAQQPDTILANAALVLKDRPQLRAERVEIAPRPGAPGLLLYFPREQEITVADRTVEFVLRVGQYQVARKFKLKEMIYRGRLEL